MTLASHLAVLERKHQALEDQIVVELAHPNKDTIKIAALKRKKLLIKDEITKIRENKPPAAHKQEGMREQQFMH